MPIKLSNYQCPDGILVEGENVSPAVGGQVVTGNLLSWSTELVPSNPIWVQDAAFFGLGGFTVMDFDPTLGQPPALEDTIAVFGMAESATQPGTKVVMLGFATPEYPAVVKTVYPGTVAFQSLHIPYEEGVSPEWHWPILDGPSGGTLTSDGSGGLYWTDPDNPPNAVEDTDATDILLTGDPVWDVLPVTVTATRSSAPAQVALDLTLFTANNNQSAQVRLLVDGTPDGTVYSFALPRAAFSEEHCTWSPVLPLGTEVLTVEVMAVGGQDVTVAGTTNVTELVLLEPAGVQTAYAAGTGYVISSVEFWSRFTDPEKENIAKVMNHAPVAGPPPSWLDVFKVTAFVSLYSARNVNLLEQDTIDHINQLETLGIIAAGRAAIILTP